MNDSRPAVDFPSPAANADNSGQRKADFPLTPVITFVAVWLGGSWLIVGAWLEPLLPGGWWSVAAGFALMWLPVWRLIRGFQGASYPSARTRLLIFRPFWYAMLFTPIIAAGILVGAVTGLPFGASGSLGRWTVAISAPVLGLVAIAGYLGSRRLVIRRFQVSMPRLPSSFDGLRLVQISDLHVGPHTSRSFLDRVKKAVQDEKPDLIVVTGDQVDDFARDVKCFNAAFGDLQAPLGVIAVAGNHDVYAGWDAVRKGLLAAGFTVLVNESIPVERGGRRLWVAGTGDPAAGGPPRSDPVAAPDIARTLQTIPEDEPVLSLAHNPALWPALADRGVDLTLSGHTHYGQFAIPFLGWSLASPFLTLAMGSHRRGHSLLYIHPGTNFWGLPIRIGAFPEIAVFSLRTSQEDAAEIVDAHQ